MVRNPEIGKIYRVKNYSKEYNGQEVTVLSRDGEYINCITKRNIELELYRVELEELDGNSQDM